MVKKSIFKAVFNYKLFFVLGFLILLIFSLYNYKNYRDLKNENIKINSLLNKTNKLLTPAPTLQPTPLSEYVFVTMPDGGMVRSCKRNSEQALIRASSASASARKDWTNCVVPHYADCKKKCEKDNNCFRLCEVDDTCRNFADISANTNDVFSKLVKENCIGSNN